MRTTLCCATLAAIALLAWWCWPSPGLAPRPATHPRAGDPAPTAPATANVPAAPPADQDSGAGRVAVDQPAGPTEAQVTCTWDGGAMPAPAIPVVVHRIDSGVHVGPIAIAATDAAGVVTFRHLLAGEHEFRALRARARARLVPGVRTRIVLTVPELAVARGLVMDAAGAAVADADVVAEIDYLPQRIATTGADGRFEVRLASRRIWASKEGHQPSRVHPFEGKDLVLQLETAGGAIHGTVLDPESRAVPHAWVAVGIDTGAKDDRQQRPHVMLAADARGQFATAQVPRARLVVFAHADGFAFGQQDVDITSADAGNVVVRLRRAATVHGVLRGGHGGDQPLAGKPVSVHRHAVLPGLLQGTSDRLTRFSSGTDHLGRYRLAGIPPGRTWLLASDAKGQPVYHSARLREGEEYEWSPDLALPSAVIRGTLQGPDGRPLAGLHVRATRIDPVQQKQERSSAETGTDGGFELGALHPFPHTLTVQTSEHGEPFAGRIDVAPDGPAFVWALTGLPSQCGAIIGRVLGPDGNPVAAVKCRALGDGIVRNSEPLPVAGGYRIANLLPGPWAIVGQVEGYGSFDLGKHLVGADGLVDLGTHSLPPCGTVSVRIAARGFEPANVELELAQEGGANKATARQFRTDAGALRSPPLPPGNYRLVARGTNFALTGRTVAIPAGGDVAVDIDAAPATTVAIEFVPEDLDEREWRDVLRFELRAADGALVWKHFLAVDRASSCTIRTGLLPGTYTVEGWSAREVSRAGRAPFVVPPGTGGLDVRVLLAIQTR